MRQCTCGRSQSYPYCDETHKKKRVKNMKDGIIDQFDTSKFVVLQDEEISKEKDIQMEILREKINAKL